VYLNIGKLYGKVEESYVSVQGGKAEVSFRRKNSFRNTIGRRK
jgi:hypothetical protein